MNEIQIRENGWPVLYVEVLGVPTDVAFAQFLRNYKTYLDRPEQYAVVFDARKAGNTPPSQRKAMAQWIEANRERFSQRVKGVAFVIDTLLVRMMLRGILMLQPMPSPHTVVEKPEEATAWCRERLAARTS